MAFEKKLLKLLPISTQNLKYHGTVSDHCMRCLFCSLGWLLPLTFSFQNRSRRLRQPYCHCILVFCLSFCLSYYKNKQQIGVLFAVYSWWWAYTFSFLYTRCIDIDRICDHHRQTDCNTYLSSGIQRFFVLVSSFYIFFWLRVLE